MSDGKLRDKVGRFIMAVSRDQSIMGIQKEIWADEFWEMCEGFNGGPLSSLGPDALKKLIRATPEASPPTVTPTTLVRDEGCPTNPGEPCEWSWLAGGDGPDLECVQCERVAVVALVAPSSPAVTPTEERKNVTGVSTHDGGVKKSTESDTSPAVTERVQDVEDPTLP